MSNLPKLASAKQCTGCLVCADTCNLKAILIESRHELLYPVVDNDKCVGCKLCEKACPVVSPIENTYDIKKATAYAAWSKDDKVRMNAASGGFCSSLAIDTINKGGKVATCSWIDGKPKFILTDKINDLKIAANSKYVQSDASGIYKKVRQELNKGYNILFIGLPCQVAAIKTYLNGKFEENLTTIELICSPPTSMEAVEIQNKLTNSQLIRFRTKNENHNWGRDKNLIIRKNGKDVFVENGAVDDVFYKVFSSELTARASCMKCRFANFKRQADYTVGDFHGYKGDGDKGVSLVISKSEQTNTYLQEIATLHLENADIRQALCSNPRFYIGTNTMRFHPAFVWRNTFHKLPESIRMGFYLLKMPYKILWGIYRVLDKISIRIKSNALDKQFK